MLIGTINEHPRMQHSPGTSVLPLVQDELAYALVSDDNNMPKLRVMLPGDAREHDCFLLTPTYSLVSRAG